MTHERTLGQASEPPRATRLVPILGWIRAYDRSWFSGDAIAGLTIWGLVVPQGMAYAGIAGLPPQAGLYTLVASLLIYALLGTSRHLVVSGTSASAALLASSVAGVLAVTAAANGGDPATYAAYAAAFVLVVGVVFLAAGVARLGFVTQFLSKPVMDGFVVGLSIFVAVGQLNKLFGVAKPDGNTVEKFFGIVRSLPEANWATFAIGALALLALWLLPLLSKRIPAGLVVLFGSIAISSALDLSGKYGVLVVGELPQGLPSVALPVIPIADYMAMILPAIGVVLVVFSEALGVAHEFADKHGYEVDADQELNAHAVTNVAAAMFGGIIGGGGMSASAVKEGAGARSQVSNLVTWGATIVTLLFLTPLFAPLPEAVLAALIIHAVWSIITSRKLMAIRRQAPAEVWFGVLALAGVLLIDVLEGMVIGLVASLVVVIFRSCRPHVSSLGRLPTEQGAFSDLERNPEAVPVPGILIIRPDAQLYYANALTVRDKVNAMIRAMDPPPRAVVFDGAAQDTLDLTTRDVLIALVRRLEEQHITVVFADAHAPIIEAAGESVFGAPQEHRVFATVDAAVRHLAAQEDSQPAPADAAGRSELVQ